VVDHDGRRFEVSTPARAAVEHRDREVTWYPVGAPEPLVIDVVALFARVAARERRTRGG
jgi:5,10-methenyltetrahydromethanopterin hydrogenase